MARKTWPTPRELQQDGPIAMAQQPQPIGVALGFRNDTGLPLVVLTVGSQQLPLEAAAAIQLGCALLGNAVMALDQRLAALEHTKLAVPPGMGRG